MLFLGVISGLSQTYNFTARSATLLATINEYLVGVSFSTRLLIFIPLFIIYKVSFYLWGKMVKDEEKQLVNQNLTLYLFSLFFYIFLILLIFRIVSANFYGTLLDTVRILILLVPVLRFFYFVFYYNGKGFLNFVLINLSLVTILSTCLALAHGKQFEESYESENKSQISILNINGDDTITVYLNRKSKTMTARLLLLNQTGSSIFLKPRNLGQLAVYLKRKMPNPFYDARSSILYGALNFEKDSLRALAFVTLKPSESQVIFLGDTIPHYKHFENRVTVPSDSIFYFGKNLQGKVDFVGVHLFTISAPLVRKLKVKLLIN
jgi:hypothetical protein